MLTQGKNLILLLQLIGDFLAEVLLFFIPINLGEALVLLFVHLQDSEPGPYVLDGSLLNLETISLITFIPVGINACLVYDNISFLPFAFDL